MSKLRATLRVIVTTWQQFYQDTCLNHAAGLAYTTLLSLVPLLAVGFSILSAFPVYHNVSQKIQSLIFTHIVAGSAQTMQKYFLNFIAQAPKLSIVGMVGLLFTAVLLVFSMEQTFNKIWRVKRNRHGAVAFLLYWAMITLIPILVATLFGIVNYFNALIKTNSIQIYMPYLSTFTALFFLYLALPNCKVPIISAAVAAIVTTILFELAHHGFVLYVNNFADYALIYGALATIPIFLIWLYISWVIVLFGVVLSYVLTKYDYRKNGQMQ